MPKKKKREAEGNLAASIILGLLTAVVGALLGIFSLAVQPVAEVREMPAEENIKEDTVYFIMGKDNRVPYKRKETAFVEGKTGQISLSEADLNNWAADTFKFSKPKPEEGESSNMILLTPSSPSFRIADSVLQVSMNVEVEAFGKKRKMKYFSKGDFTNTGMGYAFTPHVTYMGSAQLPPVGVASLIGDRLLDIFKQTERYPEFQKAWSSLSNVRLEGDQLILVR